MRYVNQMPEETLKKITDFLDRYSDWQQLRTKLFGGDVSLNEFKVLGTGHNGVVLNMYGYAVKYFKLTGYNRERWSKDARILEQLNGCSYVPKIYAYTEDYMITELIDGVNLDEYTYDESKRKGIKFTVSVVEQLKEAIEDIFNRKVAIDDMRKRDNYMITKEGKLILVDVGCFHQIGKHVDYDSFKEYMQTYDVERSIACCTRFEDEFFKKEVKKLVNGNKLVKLNFPRNADENFFKIMKGGKGNIVVVDDENVLDIRRDLALEQIKEAKIDFAI